MGDAGVDVSGYNNVLDWGAVRTAGTGWAWSKATEATGYVNGRFVQQVQGARAAGLVAGAYHFADPRYSPAAQVQHFVDVARPQGAFSAGAMLPMLDMENEPGVFSWAAGQANTYIRAFRDLLRQATGQNKLCVYASQSWWLTGFLQPDQWADGDVYLCAARYGVTAGNVGWTHPRLAAHQYTDASQPYALDRSVTVGGFTLGQLTIGAPAPLAQTPEGPDMFAFPNESGWLRGVHGTGEIQDLREQVQPGTTVFRGIPVLWNLTPDDIANLEAKHNRWEQGQNNLANLATLLAGGVGGGGGAAEYDITLNGVTGTMTPKANA